MPKHLDTDTEPHRALAKRYTGDMLYHRKVKLDRCAGSVLHDGAFHSSQCNNRRRSDSEHTAYCAIHDPIRVRAKHAARRAKWEAEWKATDARRERAAALVSMRNRAAVILRQIAHGHNDPRAMAAEWLVEWDKLQETPTDDS